MPVRDRRVSAKNQLRLSIRFRCEVRRWTERKTGDPIAAPDEGVRFQMKKRDIFANREVINATAFLHDQAIGKHPGQPNVAAWMNVIAKLLFQERAPNLPRKDRAQQNEYFPHVVAPNWR